ncbi:hypothetical protein [Halorussus salinus]|uniref:hypothetical protein n=1 Tax=Halorussus salinus TaxID=1364935 RepID=UPI0010924472|nr:hypothetical protein [Halorussus salinus]
MPTDSAESEPTASDAGPADSNADGSPTPPADSPTFAWSHTPAESRLLRGLVALPVGVVSGFALGLVLGALGFVVLIALNGRYLLAAGTLLAFVFALSRTAPHLLAHRTGDFDAAFRGLGARTLAAGTVAGVAVLAVGALVLPDDLFPVFVGATLVGPLLVASLFSSEGELDAEAGRLTYQGTDVDLSTLVGVGRWSVGGYVAYRLSYAAGAATFTTPRTLVVPRRVDSHLRDALDAGVAADAGDPGPSRTAVRLVAAAIGLSLFAFAGLLLTADPTGVASTGGSSRGDAVLWYAALIAGLFGAIFLSLGIRGG